MVAQGVCLLGPFFFFFSCNICFVFNYMEQRQRAGLAMSNKKTHVPRMYPSRHDRKSHQPKSLWSGTNRTPAT